MKAPSRFAFITTTLVALSLSAIAQADMKTKGKQSVTANIVVSSILKFGIT